MKKRFTDTERLNWLQKNHAYCEAGYSASFINGKVYPGKTLRGAIDYELRAELRKERKK